MSRLTRNQALTTIGRFIRALAGEQNEHSPAAASVHTVIGFAALSSIKDDFITKSRGGVGAGGIKWPPLSPKTLAYGRRASKGRGYAPGGKDGLLSKAQLKRWQQIYGHTLARLAVSTDIGSAKARAAQIAWAQIKREGGKTKIAEYANRPHEILRDTGVMLNSLSPGHVAGSPESLQYVKPAGDGGDEQVFELKADSVIVGTNVARAKAHDQGNRSKGLPQRKIIPDDVPVEWLEDWSSAGAESIGAGIELALEAA